MFPQSGPNCHNHLCVSKSALPMSAYCTLCSDFSLLRLNSHLHVKMCVHWRNLLHSFCFDFESCNMTIWVSFGQNPTPEMIWSLLALITVAEFDFTFLFHFCHDRHDDSGARWKDSLPVSHLFFILLFFTTIESRKASRRCLPQFVCDDFRLVCFQNANLSSICVLFSLSPLFFLVHRLDLVVRLFLPLHLDSPLHCSVVSIQFSTRAFSPTNIPIFFSFSSFAQLIHSLFSLLGRQTFIDSRPPFLNDCLFVLPNLI